MVKLKQPHEKAKMEKRKDVEIELLKAIAEQKHLRVGVPNHFQSKKLFFYYGFPVKLNKSWLILDTCNGMEAVELDDIISIHVVENKFREGRRKWGW